MEVRVGGRLLDGVGEPELLDALTAARFEHVPESEEAAPAPSPAGGRRALGGTKELGGVDVGREVVGRMRSGTHQRDPGPQMLRPRLRMHAFDFGILAQAIRLKSIIL